MHPKNMGKLTFGNAKIVPCTPQAVMELLKATGVNLRGKEVVIVGHSEIVGKPLSLLLLEQFDEIVMAEGYHRDRYLAFRGTPTNKDVERARLLLRVGTTRAEKRTTILTPKSKPCQLLV